MRHSASVQVNRKQVSAARSCYPNLKTGQLQRTGTSLPASGGVQKTYNSTGKLWIARKTYKLYWQMVEYKEPYSEFICKWLSTDNWTHTFVVRRKSTDNMTHTFVVKWRRTENRTHIYLLSGGGVQRTGHTYICCQVEEYRDHDTHTFVVEEYREQDAHTSVVRWKSTENRTYIHLLSGGGVQRTGHTYICCQVEEYRDHDTHTFVVKWRSTENRTHTFVVKWRNTENRTYTHLLSSGGVQRT